MKCHCFFILSLLFRCLIIFNISLFYLIYFHGSTFLFTVFRCKWFPSKNRDATCFRPVRENRNPTPPMYCTSITTPQCQNQPYSYGSLPNVFLQRNVTEIRIELEFYDALLASGCSENLRLFLCGTYIPFCAENQNPFMMPCREVCEEVQGACLDHFRFLYGGLPWPNKLQCHRFPSSNDDARTCFMPGDV